MFHLAVDEVDSDLLDESLQSSTEVLHTRTRTEEEKESVSSLQLEEDF